MALAFEITFVWKTIIGLKPTKQSIGDKISEVVEQEDNPECQRTRPVVYLTSEKEANFHDIVQRNYRHFLKGFIQTTLYRIVYTV